MFFNTIILNYYDHFSSNEKSFKESISKTLDGKLKGDKDETIDKLLEVIRKSEYYKDDKEKEIINLKPTKITEKTIINIENNLSIYASLASYYRNLFTSYSNLKQNYRELIIFKENYNLILESIKKDKQVNIVLTNNHIINNASIYKISHSREELYNYVLISTSNSTQTIRLAKIKYITLAAVLSALIVVLSFLPIKAFVEITLTIIPISIGIIIGGYKMGLILGTIFGLISYVQCFGYSEFGATLFSINPFFTFLVCVPTRIVAGGISGFVADILRNKNSKISALAASVLMPLLNTILFTSTLVILFYQTEYIQSFVTALNALNPLHFMVLFVGINGLVELLVGIIISYPTALAINKYIIKK